MPKKYNQILQDKLMPSVGSLELPSDYFFQQDSDPKHTAKSTKNWLFENNVNGQINPIENMVSFENSNLKKSTSKHQ